MGPARIYPWRKMHRSRAPSIAPGTFFVAQSWADSITDMPGFNLRQAQAQQAARRRCSKEADHSAFASSLGPAEADCQEPIEHGVNLVGDLDRIEMSSEHRLRYDKLGAELLQAVEIARHVHQRHIRGDIGHGNLASLRRGRRIIVLREILDGRIGRLLRYLLARRQNIGLVDHLSPRQIVEICPSLTSNSMRR